MTSDGDGNGDPRMAERARLAATDEVLRGLGADLSDDPNVDDVHRRRLIVYFVEDADVARV